MGLVIGVPLSDLINIQAANILGKLFSSEGSFFIYDYFLFCGF